MKELFEIRNILDKLKGSLVELGDSL
jgi:hypothetical protein